MKYKIGIDLGGTNTAIGLVDEAGHVEAVKTIASESKDGKPASYLESLLAAITPFVQEKEIVGIGIGAPAANHETGMIELPANLPWLAWTPISEFLFRNTGVPVVLDNDAKAATIGEMTYGAARGMKNFIMLTLGTGIGSGIVADGRLIYGLSGAAGDIGHTIIRRGGRSCTCGRCGCLETYCSASGVTRTAREFISNSGKDSSLRAKPKEQVTSYDVYKAAMEGDELAMDIFQFTGEILGEALADFAHFSAPQAFILFGGLAKAGALFIGPAKESMEKNLLPGFKGKIAILQSTVPEDEAAILGAAALVK